MPNTLAHIGLQTLISKGISNKTDLRWALLSCIIPDLPWITQRVIEAILPSIDLLQLRAYVVVQASYLFCVIASAGFACLASNKQRVFWLLIIGCFIHLLFDATQIKWANGVHLLAPVSWQIWNIGWYWPESWVTYGFTLLGLVVVVLLWRKLFLEPLKLDLRWPLLAGFGLLMILYFGLPAYFMNDVVRSDSHYIATMGLSDRTGKALEFDRKNFQPRSDSSGTVELFGQQLEVSGINLTSPVTLSIKGKFTDQYQVLVHHFHIHHSGVRDFASMLGLLLVVAAFMSGLWQYSRIR